MYLFGLSACLSVYFISIKHQHKAKPTVLIFFVATEKVLEEVSLKKCVIGKISIFTISENPQKSFV